MILKGYKEGEDVPDGSKYIYTLQSREYGAGSTAPIFFFLVPNAAVPKTPSNARSGSSTAA